MRSIDKILKQAVEKPAYNPAVPHYMVEGALMLQSKWAHHHPNYEKYQIK